MKRRSRIFRLALSLLIIVLASCTETKSEKSDKAAEQVRDAKSKLDEAQKAYEEEVEDFRQSIQADIDYNKSQIEKLKKEKVTLKAKVAEERNKQIEALRERNNELEQRIREYKSNSRENWEEFKREFKNDMSELGDAFKDLGKDNVR